MTAVLDPDVLTGFHDGPVYYSAEDGRFYLLTDDGAIPADGPRYATTLDAAQLSMCGADHFTLRSDGTVDMMRPASPYTAAYEDTIMGMHFPGGLGLMGASGSSSLRKRLALNFLSGGSLDPRITFTRASSATRVNSSGLIETVSSDVARIDYDPVTLAAKGLLIEEQRTNLLLQSGWAGAVAGTPGTAPTSWVFGLSGGTLGVSAAEIGNELTFSATAERHYITQVCAASANTTYRLTAQVTANIGVQLQQMLVSGGAPAGATITFEANGTAVVGSYVPVAGDRVAVVLVVAGTAGNFSARVGIGTSSTATGSVSLKYPQLEAGSFATSYIPTTSATVTRAADVASITGTNFSDWLNPAEGTFLIQLVPKGLPSSSARYLEASIAGAAIRTPLLYATSAGLAVATVMNAGVTQATLSHSGAFAIGSRLKHAAAYKTDDFASVANGGAPQTDASGTIGQPDRLTIGWATSSPLDMFNGWIERLTYYPARLSNALLQTLST